jgi:DNA-binding transcriptional MerR regulator
VRVSTRDEQETAGHDLTIDELARETGMTVRNIRAHQSRGLLPPPEVRGRTGYYATEHIARIELIKELQADGFNLEAIRRMLQNAGGSTTDVLRFTRALRAPFDDEEPDVVTLQDLIERWGPEGSPELLKEAVKLGLYRPLGEDRYEEVSPRLARVSAELADLGVGPERALYVAARLRRHADGVAKLFVGLFLRAVWEPFDKAGRPPERWPEVLDSLERMRPLASESLLAVFQLAMTERVEKEFGREIVERFGRR